MRKLIEPFGNMICLTMSNFHEFPIIRSMFDNEKTTSLSGAWFTLRSAVKLILVSLRNQNMIHFFSFVTKPAAKKLTRNFMKLSILTEHVRKQG